MADIPAQCDNCGTWFRSGFGFTGSASFSRVSVGPCPNCRGSGRIPDGLYRVAAGSIEFIRHATTDVTEFEKLRRLLETAQREEFEPKRLASAIDLEAPAFAGLKKLLPQSRSEVQSYINILLAALALIMAFLAANPKAELPSVTQIFNSISQQPPEITSVPSTPGRNDPCPCGSGKKFKKCHGSAK